MFLIVFFIIMMITLTSWLAGKACVFFFENLFAFIVVILMFMAVGAMLQACGA